MRPATLVCDRAVAGHCVAVDGIEWALVVVAELEIERPNPLARPVCTLSLEAISSKMSSDHTGYPKQMIHGGSNAHISAFWLHVLRT